MFAFSSWTEQLGRAAMAANPGWHRRGKEGCVRKSPAGAWEGPCPSGKKRLLALHSATAVTWTWHSLLPGGVASQPATATTASPQRREWLRPWAVQNSPLSGRKGEQMDREGVSCFWKAPFLLESAMSCLCLCLCLARTCPSLSDDPNLSRAVYHHLHNPCSPLPKH